MEFEDRVYAEMEKKGIFIDGRINWGDREPQRFRPKNRYGNKKPLFVIIFNGGIKFGDWRDPDSYHIVWDKPWSEITREEKLLRQHENFLANVKKELLTCHAIWRSSLMLSHATWRGQTCIDASPNHPYVLSKKIIPYYGKQIRSYLIIPIHDIDRKLMSLQYIWPNTTKRFKEKASPKNGMVWLCEPLDKYYDGVINICEGWATGCSIHQVLGSPVVCAMQSSNILNVSVAMRRKFVSAKIRICADNDQFIKVNIGIKEAIKACKVTGASLHYPVFKYIDHDKKPTDFNDFMQLYGIDETRNELLVTR